MAYKNVSLTRRQCEQCGHGLMAKMKKVNGDEAWRCLNCGHVTHELPSDLRNDPTGVDK